jgi:hypothetical protein
MAATQSSQLQDGMVLSGRDYPLSFLAHDEHVVKRMTIQLDGATVLDQDCTNEISYACQAYYTWALRGAKGTHTVTFSSEDYFGNGTTETHSVSVE